MTRGSPKARIPRRGRSELVVLQVITPPTSGGPTTQAVYYRDASGNEPVNQFIEKLSKVERQAAIDHKTAMLNGLPASAPPLEFPHTSQIEGELRELRCRYGRTWYRILYRRSGNLFLLLHIFEKWTGPVPDASKDLAKQRFADFRARMDASPRHRPRAVGHDAPYGPRARRNTR